MTTTADGQTQGATAGCPVRKLAQPDDGSGPAIEQVAGERPRWRIRSYALARAVLRHPEGTRQAGFGADSLNEGPVHIRPPILYVEGEVHHAQRRAAAHLFAPRVVAGYREWMQATADRVVAQVRTDRWTDLTALTMEMAVEVTSRVIGLDHGGSPRMRGRLQEFFAPPPRPGAPFAGAREALRNTAVLRFFLLDVKPAIRARRRRRGDDLISALIDAGYTDLEILTECVTYAAAGMATTRELMAAAVWHLLDDDALRARYRAADRDGRVAVVEEVLRVEPVVGHLLRRTTAPLTLDGPDGPVEVPAGALIDVDLRAVNADEGIVGADPDAVCPARTMSRAVGPVVLAFGDGHHRCPGAPLASMETEIFVSALLRDDLAAAGPPRVRWNEVSQGYDLTALRVRRVPVPG
ncbi:cytochrome P450 [Cellulomonas sp. Sa3CUA2]|uniref:Cytochrome P450 n=1 Tax=Cellulomonas avistercoris TaxID=2762242 RepID=A0ABR8QCS8_9CELL|nr:cytochrome P450 [Cellulomonas avistercoris]MBD7918225.1 cytochrome P450 [Cellulomonas avistercoris]